VADQGNPAADGASAQAVVRSAIAAQLAALQALWDARQGRLKPKAVHDLCVAIRRLLTALELAEAIGCRLEPQVLRRLRKLLGRLAPARDAHVQIRSLTQLTATYPKTSIIIAALKRRRRAAARKAKKRLLSFARTELDREMSRVLAALAVPAQGGLAAAAQAAWRGELARRYLSVEHRRGGMSEMDPEGLHRVRLLLKEYRYALDALTPLLPDGALRLAKLCDALQEELGRAHDAHVLAETTAELAKSNDGASAAALKQLAADLERDAQRAHEAGARSLAEAQLEWPLPGDEPG
jgi:CHAD domain-containing protein